MNSNLEYKIKNYPEEYNIKNYPEEKLQLWPTMLYDKFVKQLDVLDDKLNEHLIFIDINNKIGIYHSCGIMRVFYENINIFDIYEDGRYLFIDNDNIVSFTVFLIVIESLVNKRYISVYDKYTENCIKQKVGNQIKQKIEKVDLMITNYNLKNLQLND